MNLDKLFNPRAVAVFGASGSERHPGYMMLYALKRCGFRGKIYPVNPGKGEIPGLKVYESIDQIADDSIDLAIVVVAPSVVLSVMEQIGRTKISFVVLITSGFRELGTPEGIRLETDIRRIAQKSKIRFVGPNCLGIYSSDSRMAFFPDQEPSDGNTALISQSGSQSVILYQLARERGVSFNKMVSSGNEADLCCVDFLDYFSTDPKIKVITAYLEGIKNGRKFIEIGRDVSLHKPTIVFKVGTTAAGGMAASSHTGAMSGKAAIWRSVLRQTGMISAESISELLDIALGFSLISGPIGRRVAIVGGPGGSSVISADACERSGLKIAGLKRDTMRQLREMLPPVGISVRNPVDMGFGATVEGIYKDILRILDADRNVDVILALGGAPTFVGKSYIRIEEFAEEMITVKTSLSKPLFTVVPHISQTQNAADMLREAGIPTFSEPDRAANTIGKMVDYYEWLRSTALLVNQDPSVL